MLIKYFGAEDNFFANGLWGSSDHLPHISDASTSTAWFLEPTDAGLNATFSGHDLELFSGNIPIGGTITGLSIDLGDTRIAEFSGMSWDADPLFSALGIAPADEAALNAFINAEQVTIDARSATSALADFQDHFSFSTDVLIRGSVFGDTLVTGSGDDVLFGSKGNDVFHSGTGDDLNKGGRGHDVFYNNFGSDTYDGGTGINTLIDIASTWAVDLGSVSVNLAAGSHSFSNLTTESNQLSNINNYTFIGHEDVTVVGTTQSNTLKTGRGDDHLIGGQGDDRLLGNKGSDVIKGGAGNDKLFGGRGHDNLFGGTGDDTINAGAGNDRITSGAGSDVLIFNDVAFENRTVITDFSDGSDIIRVTNNSGFDAIQIGAINENLDTLITLSGGTEIVLKGVDAAVIDQFDFDLL